MRFYAPLRSSESKIWLFSLEYQQGRHEWKTGKGIFHWKILFPTFSPYSFGNSFLGWAWNTVLHSQSQFQKLDISIPNPKCWVFSFSFQIQKVGNRLGHFQFPIPNPKCAKVIPAHVWDHHHHSILHHRHHPLWLGISFKAPSSLAWNNFHVAPSVQTR